METFESKWGFHGVNYETFVMLRKLNQRVCETKSALAGRKRFMRKKDRNRVIRESIRNEKKQRVGYEVVGRMSLPNVCPHLMYGNQERLDPVCMVIALTYRQQKKPMPAKHVLAPHLSVKQITELYHKVETWFSRK